MSAKTGKAKFLDPKVSARVSALNAIGGVKVDVFVRVRPRLQMVCLTVPFSIAEMNTLILPNDADSGG